MDGQDELTPAEALLARRIAELGSTPSATARQRIMAAVRESLDVAPDPLLERPGRRFGFRSLMVGVGVAAAVIAGTVGALAASVHALPSSPAYRLRVAEEDLRLMISDPAGKEQLRIDFARDRLAEARALHGSDQTAVTRTLLKDARSYLSDAQQDSSTLSDGQRNQVLSEINTVVGEEREAELEAIQQGIDIQGPTVGGGSSPAPTQSTSPPEPSADTSEDAETSPSQDGQPQPTPGSQPLKRPWRVKLLQYAAEPDSVTAGSDAVTGGSDAVTAGRDAVIAGPGAVTAGSNASIDGGDAFSS